MNVRDLPAHALSRLITKPDDKRKATPYATLDATGALTRGIAEYVASLSLDGVVPVFLKSFDEWADLEDEAVYPSFIAYCNDSEGTYEGAAMSTRVSGHRYPDGTYEASSAELAIDVKCEAWANDPNQRALLVALLERAFSPVDWMYGFRMELPHYYGQRATYEPQRILRVGGEAEALRRYAIARMTVRATVPVTSVLPFAEGKPMTRVTVTQGGLVVPEGAVVGV